MIIPLEAFALFSLHLPQWVELPLFIGIALYFGKDVFKSGIQSLFVLNFSNINLIMTIVVVGAFFIHQYEEAVIIIVLFALGQALQDLGIEKKPVGFGGAYQ